jgi:peroxiredoxin
LFVVGIAFLFVSLYAVSLMAKTHIAPGDLAQDFTLTDSNGASHTLSAYRGDVVVLYFAMWCTTCRANTLELQQEIYLPLKDKGVNVFTVDYLDNKQPEVRSIVQDLKLAYPALLDDQTLTDRYDGKMSLTLVIDRKGVIRYCDFYDIEKVKTAVAEAAGVRLAASLIRPKEKNKKEQRQICSLPRKITFLEKQVFHGSSAKEYFGFAVSPGPVDLNKDGLPEVVIGAPAAKDDKGAVFIHYGRNAGSFENPDFILTGKNAGSRFGASLLVTDVNNDDIPDLIVGGSMSRKSRGGVSVFLNSKNGLSQIPEHIIEGGTAGDWFGSSLAAGDFNKDGFADLAVAALNEANRGAVHLYYGARTGISGKTTVINGNKAYNYFGSAACIGDINHDSFDDLIVSATGENGKGVDRGAVYVFFGGTEGIAGNADIIIEGENDMDEFGGALLCNADLDEDGRRDLVIGASGSSKVGKHAGAVLLFFGPLIKGSSGANILNAVDADLTLTHGESGSMYGSCLTGLGDVNGDGIDDFAVGAMNAQKHPERAGAVYIYYGSRDRKIVDHEVIFGDREDGRFGRDISSLGRMGFIVTETGNSEKADKNGAVRFFAAPTTPPDETECVVCGMILNKYRHTRFELTEKNGIKHATCGVQCGLVLQLRLKDAAIRAEATDFISGRLGDAAKMFYVYKSDAVPDMWPSFIAFSKKSDAKKFSKGFGGAVLNYEQALKKAELIR